MAVVLTATVGDADAIAVEATAALAFDARDLRDIAAAIDLIARAQLKGVLFNLVADLVRAARGRDG